MQCLSFFQQAASNGETTEDSELNKYTTKSSKACVMEVNLEYPKDLCELRNDYPLAKDKIEIKKEMLIVITFLLVMLKSV